MSQRRQFRIAGLRGPGEGRVGPLSISRPPTTCTPRQRSRKGAKTAAALLSPRYAAGTPPANRSRKSRTQVVASGLALRRPLRTCSPWSVSPVVGTRRSHLRCRQWHRNLRAQWREQTLRSSTGALRRSPRDRPRLETLRCSGRCREGAWDGLRNGRARIASREEDTRTGLGARPAPSAQAVPVACA